MGTKITAKMKICRIVVKEIDRKPEDHVHRREAADHDFSIGETPVLHGIACPGSGSVSLVEQQH